MTQCSAHGAFERMIQACIERLADRIAQGIESLAAQSTSNGEAIKDIAERVQDVLSNQADRRELCGRQGARLDALEKSDTLQWKAITDLRRLVWTGAGALAVLQIVVTIVAQLLLK